MSVRRERIDPGEARAQMEWGKLWFRTFPTSARTFRTTAKQLLSAVASPGRRRVFGLAIARRPWARARLAAARPGLVEAVGDRHGVRRP